MNYTFLAIGIGSFLSAILKSSYSYSEYLFYFSLIWFLVGGYIVSIFQRHYENITQSIDEFGIELGDRVSVGIYILIYSFLLMMIFTGNMESFIKTLKTLWIF